MQEITVAKVEKPAEGRKQGTVHDTKGGRWKVWADKLASYNVGSTYDVTYKVNNFNGQTFNVIENMVMKAAGTPQQVQAAATTYTQADDKKSDDIAVQAIVKSYIEVGAVPLGGAELAHALRTAYSEWRKFQEWKKIKPMPSKIETGRQTAEEFNDAIPDFPGDR